MTTTATSDLDLALLAAIRTIVREELRAARRPVVSLSRADRARLARILPAIGGVVGSDEFLVRELFESDAAALRLVLRGLTPIQTGRLLRRAEGRIIDAYRIERSGAELHTTLWRVVQVSGVLEAQTPAVPPRVPPDRVK
jgi:hypothetical protein